MALRSTISVPITREDLIEWVKREVQSTRPAPEDAVIKVAGDDGIFFESGTKDPKEIILRVEWSMTP